MKKYICLIILLLFCFGFSSPHLKVIARKNATPASSCPPFYADANVVFSWNGDHDSGTNYACEADGTAVAGTNNNLTMNTSYGESGSYGGRMNSLDDYLRWANTSNKYIDDASSVTIFVRAKHPTPTTSCSYFESVYDADNLMCLQVNSTCSSSRVVFNGQANNDSADASVSCGSFVTTGISWQNVGSSGDLSSYNGSSWDRDSGELGHQWSTDSAYVTIGEDARNQGPCGAGLNTDIDRFVIISGFEQSPPTNW